jgi:hypothetical protein
MCEDTKQSTELSSNLDFPDWLETRVIAVQSPCCGTDGRHLDSWPSGKTGSASSHPLTVIRRNSPGRR